MSKSESFARHQASAEGIGVGKLIEGEAERDAIHIAVVPVTAGTKLYPGQHVGLIRGKADIGTTSLGIVDPYLKSPVYDGQKFWLFLYPGTITSLRHMWTHPHFEGETGGHRPGTIDPNTFDAEEFPLAETSVEALEASLPPSIRKKDKPVDPKVAAQEFMEEFARTHGMGSAESAISRGRYYLENGDYMNVGEMESWYVGDDFWNAYEVLTGEKVSPDDRGSFFSCSC